MAKRSGSLDADDVLADRVKIGATELIALVHRENPTGRALGARETEERYARKARLQSLLVRRFKDELIVVPDPEHPGTVSLRHQGRDACHAVIATLDEDARAWVQLQVDLGPTPEAAPPAAPRASPRGAPKAPAGEAPDALLRRAEEEIAAYDYEAARRTLALAVEASGGASGPAAALLELLVETLGDDAAALDVEASLSRPALGDPRVRGALALAASRTGLEERALALLRGVGDAPAAVALGALAATVLARGDTEGAVAHLERARKLDPASPALPGIAADITRARAAAREPAEAELSALVAAGHDDEAEKKADALLARWPESEAARRAHRTIEERRRRSEAARLTGEAEAALASGAMGLGLGLLRHAAAAARGAEREALERRAHEIEAADQAKREAHQVEEVCRSLAGAEERGALLAYLDLDEALRARVRARSRGETVALLDATPAGRAAARVDAVLALLRARSLLERDPEGALALLAHHAALLERVSEARKIGREAEASLRARRAGQAREAVRAARAALAAGAAAEALARLDDLSRRDLPEEARAEVEACAAEAAGILERRRRAGEAARLRAAGRLFEARALAEGEALAAIRAEIRTACRVEVDNEPRPAKDLARFRDVPLMHRPYWQLTADGRRIVAAEAHDRWVVVRVLELSTQEVRPTILFRTPEPLGRVHATVCGATLWLCGGLGPLVELSMDPWELRDIRPRADVARPGEDVDLVTVVAGEDPSSPRYLWVGSYPHDAALRARPLRVLDLSQRRPTREVEWGYAADPVAGAQEGRVVVLRDEAPGHALYTARGAPSPSRFPPGLRLHGVVTHPRDLGLVACLSRDEDGEEDSLSAIVLAPISPAGDLGRPLEAPTGSYGSGLSVASSRVAGLVFVVLYDDTVPTTLRAFSPDAGGGLSPLWEEPLTGELVLVQDAAARVVAALAVQEEGVAAVTLGPTPPRLPSRPPRRSVHLRQCFHIIACEHLLREKRVEVRAVRAVLKQKTRREVQAWVAERERDPAATADELLDLVYALRMEVALSATRLGNDLALRLPERFPDHPHVRLAAASKIVDRNLWTGARELLDGIDPAAFDAYEAQHFHHVRALVALREHRLDDAAAAYQAARELGGGCMLNMVEPLFEPMPSSASEITSPLSELRWAVQEADACFARGDAAEALSLLDRPMIWEVREAQSLARIAEAHLQLDAPTGPARVRKLCGLAAVLDALGPGEMPDRVELPCRGAWDEARLAAIVARARAWVDGQ